MAETYTTLGESAVASAYTSGGTSLVVASGASFPAAGNFRVRADNEIFKVTARSGGTLTVAGAQEGTSAANHAFGAAVTEVLTAEALDAIRSDMSSTGLLSAIPTGSNGDHYYATDSLYSKYVKLAGVWRPTWRDFLVAEPALASFTAVNSASASAANGGITLTVPSSASYSVKAMSVAQPSTPYALTAIVSSNFATGANQLSGIGFYDGTKLLTVSNLNQSLWLEVYYWSSVTAIVSQEFVTTAGFLGPPNGSYFLRIANDGATLTFSVSFDGISYTSMYTQSVGTRLTPTHIIFWGVENNSLAYTTNLLHWKLT